MIKQILILFFASTVLALGLNLISPKGIDYIGKYRSISNSDGPIVPPEAEEGDPPFIDIDQAYLDFTTNSALFVDAREVEEFECGTIPGAISIPFEYLPDENLAEHIDSILGRVDSDQPLVVFCSGEECDLSLHLGRNLAALEYSRVSIFFGGAREWENADLEIERRVPCGE